MANVELSDEAAKMIATLRNSGYDVAANRIATKIIQTLQTEADGTIKDEATGNLLLAASFLLEYRDLIKALGD